MKSPQVGDWGRCVRMGCFGISLMHMKKLVGRGNKCLVSALVQKGG